MRRTARLAAFVLSAMVVPVSAQAPVQMHEVLASTDQHHPLVLAELATRDAAEAGEQRARGAFDPQLRARGALRRGGYYHLDQVDVELRQATPLWGTEVWAGYRRGVGDQERYPSYYGDETLDAGEVRAGVRVPLWRDGPRDARRAARDVARFNREGADHAVAGTRQSLRRRATDAYFDWVTAGHRLVGMEALRRLAEVRVSQVERRVESGLLAPVELLEAQRSVLSRGSAVVSARRAFERAGLELGLYLRDAAGEPRTPTLDELPAQPDAPAAPSAASEVLACHPELRRWRARQLAAEVESRLARSQVAPQLDASAQVSRDFGEGSETLVGTAFEVKLELSVPLGLRQARGARDAAAADVREVSERARWAREQLERSLDDALSAWRAAEERGALTESLVEVSARLAAAERRRFDEGATTLMVVNLREQAELSATLAVLDALRGLWAARARWVAVTGCGGADDD